MTAHGPIAHHGLLSVEDHHLATAPATRSVGASRVRVERVRVQRADLAGFHAEAVVGGVVEQTSSIDALLHGAYEGDVTFAELARHGDLGIGTVQHLDGEMIALDGEFLQVRADGSVHRIPPETATPFAVICRFEPGPPIELEGTSFAALRELFDRTADDELVQAVRIDGDFEQVALRSVPRQEPPYPPLSEVVAHQTAWQVHDVVGSIVGFRFPAVLQGIEVAGLHLHFVSDDRRVGGHVTDLSLRRGSLQLQDLAELHVEVPVGVAVAEADAGADLAESIRAVEGGRAPGAPLASG
jgi:acetolactate decarboxylase